MTIKEMWLVAGLTALALLFLGLFGSAISAYECDRFTRGITQAHRYAWYGVCEVEEAPGRWVPLGNRRAR